jgi:hypothetical protein
MVAFIVVNWIAVLVAAIVSMVIGIIWYGPLFGKKWMEMSGKTMKDFEGMKSKMPIMYLKGFVMALITAYVLATIIGWLGVNTIVDGAVIGVWAWIGFVATVQYGSVLWEGKRHKLFLLNTAQSLVSLIVMGALIAAL